jgi:hypothetical protein
MREQSPVQIPVITVVPGHRCAGNAIPAYLRPAFAAWQARFERRAATPDFEWAAFHTEGLFLARHLKAHVGSACMVVYEKPLEDPRCHLMRRREVSERGWLIPVPMRDQYTAGESSAGTTGGRR